MKRLKILAVSAVSSLVVIGTASANLILTGIIDGGLSGGLPKAIELFAASDIADLSTWSIDNANNGALAFDGTVITLSGSVTAGSFLYVASESTGFTSYFGFAPDFTGNSLNVNGDDVVGVFNNAVLVDVYGVLGVDGTGEPWEYLDGWAYRNNGAGPNATFTVDEWTVSALDVTDGTTTVDQTGFPVGTYVIPEPGTLGLMALGLLGVAYRRRR